MAQWMRYVCRRRSSVRRGFRDVGRRGERLEERRVLAAQPVITEFMAVNDSSWRDNDGQFSDWIEVANLGDAGMSLKDWALTDDAANLGKWRFPEVVLAAGQHLIVVASGQDRVNPSAPLHANFRLASEGEYLALVDPQGHVVSAYAPAYPEQVSDTSYGVFRGGEPGYFALATPGATNPSPPNDVPSRAIVINEIMYHPPTERDGEEFIELLNWGTQSLRMQGWRISGGIDVTLPDVTLAAGQTLVVAADLAAFRAIYGPGVTAVGPWTGRLSNQSDTITLRDAEDRVVDRVTYADEGDWAQRGRGPNDRGTQGWVWLDDHDGGGKSLELVNPRLPNEWGQSWLASAQPLGTPGSANSVADQDAAPLILQLTQTPPIPRATDSVAVSARILDESVGTVTVALHWRLDGAADFTTTPMRDDGLDGDLLAGDGVYRAVLPPQPDRTVVEYFVAAFDGLAQLRTWPAATADAGQVTNALYQVIAEFDPNLQPLPEAPPVYYQIMTAAERVEFTAIDRLSDAQMNATFISVDGAGIELRHNAGVRIRGSGSRQANPPNNRINLPSDLPWHGVTALTLNVDTVRNQVAGSILFRLAGLPTAEAFGAVMYSNGVNLRGTGLYAHLEPLTNDFADNHFPLDNGGNLYKGRRPDESPPGGQGAGLAYLGTDPVPYSSYTKLTNESQADWSDVIQLTDVLNNAPDATYLEQLAQVVDVDQWLRYFAMHVLVSNTEGGLVNGDRLGDDYAMYRGVQDPRFIMVPHDLDTILSQVNRGLLTAINVPALSRMLLHPELKPRYFEHLIDLIDNVFLADETAPLLRAELATVATSNQIEDILKFLRDRADFVRAQIPRDIQVTTALSQTNGRVETTETALGLYGTADYRASSLLINGVPAQFNQSRNFWQIGSFEANLVPPGSTWQYLDDGSDQGTAWQEFDFVPGAAWKSGAAELGYGDNDEATTLSFGADPERKPITNYFRHEFSLPDASRYDTLLAQLLVDDGAVVYLNGQEVVRRNLPNDLPITAQTVANSDVTGGAERTFNTYTLDPSRLRDGKNVLAVEVHQFAARNADLSFNLRLYGRYNPPNSGVPLRPGVNHLVIQAMSGADGTGSVVATRTVDVWRDTGRVTAVAGALPTGTTTWLANAGPYQLSGQVVVPADAKLVIEPGASVYFEAGAELRVLGTLVARGTETARIRFTSVPGLPPVPDLPGLPAGPARWKGVHFEDTRSPENVIAFADLEFAQDANGSIGVLNSHAVIDRVTIRGTHYRMVYATNASLVVSNSDFPDMFAANEDPAQLGLDNISEHIKAIGRTPAGGQFVIQGNRFGSNKGHNDVIDVDSNRVTQGPIVQILDNVFTGVGDELLDLGGDVLVAGNLFRGVAKDESNNDRGYASAISTGDAGANTTIVVTRNVFFDVDHAINLKASAATIFEYNTVVQVHPDFIDRFGNPSVASAINLFVDEPGASRGAGAYVGHNLFWDVPRVFGNADLPAGQASALQLDHNLLSPDLARTTVANRPGTILDLGSGNVVEDPRLIDPAGGNWGVRPGSAALAPTWPAPWGATAEAALWIDDEPASPTTARPATLTVGGPGMFGFRYRVNGGEWTEVAPIGTGFDPAGTVRTATISLNGLPNGQYVLEAQGRDFAGNWQQQPTLSRPWTVNADLGRIVINEILADNQHVLGPDGTRGDLVELHNTGLVPVNLRGMRLSDNAARPDKFVFAQDAIIPPGGFWVLSADDQASANADLEFGLNRDGEALYLYSADGTLLDAVEFGPQVPDRAIGRVGPGRAWQLTDPSFGAANVPARTGDATGLRINEWLANSVGGADFVELYNPDPLPVELSGLWLSDAGDGTPRRHVIAPLSFIAGRGFVAYTADGEAAQGPDHLAFQLSLLPETLRLSFATGQAIDTLVYGPQRTGIAQGRWPDGAAELRSFPEPTPGWVNGGGPAGDLNRDGQLDLADVDLLCAALRTQAVVSDALDLNRDQRLDPADLQYLIETLLDSTFGDANLDGLFNSRDLVLIFQAGQYEDNLVGNSTWTTGDWNCDGEFGTQDLVVAFQAGGYSFSALPISANGAKGVTETPSIGISTVGTSSVASMPLGIAPTASSGMGELRAAAAAVVAGGPPQRRLALHDAVLAAWDGPF